MNPIPIENQIKGWLMVAAFVLFTLFVVWPAHAHDTLFQDGPRYAENMMGLEAIMSIPPLMGIVLAGAALLIIGITCLGAYFYEADEEPEDLDWPNCEEPRSAKEIEAQLNEDDRKARNRARNPFIDNQSGYGDDHRQAFSKIAKADDWLNR